MPTGERARPTDIPPGQVSLGAWLLGRDTEVWDAGRPHAPRRQGRHGLLHGADDQDQLSCPDHNPHLPRVPDGGDRYWPPA